MNDSVISTIVYKDSEAAILTRDNPSYYLINYCWIEDGRWVNGGQGLAFDSSEVESELAKSLPIHLANLPRIKMISQLPSDITPFTEFLSGQNRSPEEFILSVLSDHKLVINGEYHRRKVSWDMLERLISVPASTRKRAAKPSADRNIIRRLHSGNETSRKNHGSGRGQMDLVR